MDPLPADNAIKRANRFIDGNYILIAALEFLCKLARSTDASFILLILHFVDVVD